MSTSIGGQAVRSQPVYRAPINRAQRVVPIRDVLRSVWTDPRGAVREGMRTDAARLVIGVAFLAGMLDGFQNFAIGRSLKPHWGPFAVLFALLFGPLISFAQFAISGALVALVGRMLGGSATASDIRVAIACSRVPELIALPFWIPMIGVYGTTIFEQDQPYPVALFTFMLLQGMLLAWSWVIRVVMVAEAHDFSCWRAFFAMVLAWLVPIVVLVAVAIAFGASTEGVKA